MARITALCLVKVSIIPFCSKRSANAHGYLCFFVGYGEPVAMEGALKIKEMCYLHAEGTTCSLLFSSSQCFLSDLLVYAQYLSTMQATAVAH